MSAFSEVSLLLVNTLGSLFLLIVVLRFLLQLVRADFYNPLSQFIVKATNPLLLPLRRFIPGFGGMDIAALVLAFVVQWVLLLLLLALQNVPLIFDLTLIWALVGVFSLLLNIYFWGLIITVIASWLAPNSYNPALILIGQILEPVMRPIRSRMPDMGGLDLSPIVLFLLIKVVEILFLYPLAQMANLPRGLIVGI
ncbi:MAG: YggT family protein [Bacterioplanes sp.]|nr:YggT family protein [Bacterioplanes sp.]